MKAKKVKKAKKNNAKISWWWMCVFSAIIIVGIVIVYLVIANWHHDSDLAAAMKRHSDLRSKSCEPVEIVRMGTDGTECSGRGVLMSYNDGWIFVWTVGHVFEKKYGDSASYRVFQEEKPIGWITGVITPQEFNAKLSTEFSPDVVVCGLGKGKTYLNSIKVTTAAKIHDAGVPLAKPFVLKPLEKGLTEMPVEAVIEWRSPFPVFAARKPSSEGESGSGYIGPDGRLFLLSGSNREYTFLVSANPMNMDFTKSSRK